MWKAYPVYRYHVKEHRIADHFFLFLIDSWQLKAYGTIRQLSMNVHRKTNPFYLLVKLPAVSDVYLIDELGNNTVFLFNLINQMIIMSHADYCSNNEIGTENDQNQNQY